jgi:hypothetical protein
MNELKNVTNKLFKTELATERVELGLIQDLEKEYSKIVNSTKEIVSEGTRIGKEIFNFRDTYAVDAGKFIDLQSKYINMAKDLGVDVDPKFKKALDDLSEAKTTFKSLVGR